MILYGKSTAARSANPLDFFIYNRYNFIMKTVCDGNAFVQKGFASLFYF